MVDPREVQTGSKAFRMHEKRDAIYKVSTFLVDHFWGDPPQMADALGVLLLARALGPVRRSTIANPDAQLLYALDPPYSCS